MPRNKFAASEPANPTLTPIIGHQGSSLFGVAAGAAELAGAAYRIAGCWSGAPAGGFAGLALGCAATGWLGGLLRFTGGRPALLSDVLFVGAADGRAGSSLGSEALDGVIAGWLYRSSVAAVDPLEAYALEGGLDGGAVPAVAELGSGQAQRASSAAAVLLLAG